MLPSNSLTKKISYVIYEEDNSIKLEYDYKNLNNYNKKYKKAMDKEIKNRRFKYIF